MHKSKHTEVRWGGKMSIPCLIRTNTRLEQSHGYLPRILRLCNHNHIFLYSQLPTILFLSSIPAYTVACVLCGHSSVSETHK